jgi:HEPN domain-containing protein
VLFLHCKRLSNLKKNEYIEYWLLSAEEDAATMNYLFRGKRYVHSLFFGHLYLEKICKALWIKNNKDSYPPKIHNLLAIINQSGISLDDEQLLFLLKLNQYQIEGRYPDDIKKLYAITDKKTTENYILNINKIAICLQKKLQ